MAEFLSHMEASDKYAKKSKANAGLTLGIIGTSLAALVASNQNGGGGLLGGILGGGNSSNNQNACGIPSPFELWRQESLDNIALTKAIYESRITDLQEKQGIYNYVNQKFCALDQRVTALESAKPYEQQILDLKFQLAQQNTDSKFDRAEEYTRAKFTESMAYTTQLDCRNIKGEVVLPNTPVVQGFGSYSPCRPVASK